MTRFSNAAVETSMLDEFIRQGANSKLLTREEEGQLFVRIKAGGRDGERARDELINRHLRLAMSCARKFSYTGIPHEDLVQEGNIGLIKAVEKFEVERGFRFVTYAAWWVRQTIAEHVRDSGRTIRLPAGKMDKLKLMRRVVAELSTGARVPSDTEVARKMRISVEDVHDLMEWAHEPVSINVKIGDDGSAELGDLIADRNAVNPEAKVVENDMHARIETALSGLKEREREVILARFGMLDGVAQTLEELGERYGVTRERIRQIEAKALEKLGKGPHARILKSFL
jgi:RNA polymerase primary sigma factor